jgi:hypothetical protein
MAPGQHGGRSLKSRLILVGAALVALAACGTAHAVTSLEGYTEAFSQINGDSRVWRLDNP